MKQYGTLVTEKLGFKSQFYHVAGHVILVPLFTSLCVSVLTSKKGVHKSYLWG